MCNAVGDHDMQCSLQLQQFLPLNICVFFVVLFCFHPYVNIRSYNNSNDSVNYGCEVEWYGY